MLFRLITFVIPTFLVNYSVWYFLYDSLFLFNWLCCTTFLLIISWSLGYYFWELNDQEQIQARDKIVLVTGCDTGFGHQVAQKLDQFGFHVYAAVLFPDGEGSKRLKQKCSNRLKVVEMDVTKPSQVQQVFDEISQANKPLWAVINNAGIGISVPFDWGNDVEVYQKTFDVNLFGMVRVTKASMPLLRKSKGRIVNVASVAGRLSLQYLGHYCMSKNSVRVFSNVLRLELAQTGIQIITIEPDFYKTPIYNFENIEKQRNKIFEETPQQIKQFYDDNFRMGLKNTNKLVELVIRSNIDEVAEAMLKAVTLKHPKLFYRCCTYLNVLIFWASSHLPETILDAVYTLVKSI